MSWHGWGFMVLTPTSQPLPRKLKDVYNWSGGRGGGGVALYIHVYVVFACRIPKICAGRRVTQR